ncbi:GNAT family N-acetyltransferase [Phycisphaerales bacterium AB-hyl4]|uniref:GNAT family N-acetyltransferase n=1 Tax=Natronomicrosphaera hydrolytica TaxID=3242702 RepID=A0ABV4U6K6_9BACT
MTRPANTMHDYDTIQTDRLKGQRIELPDRDLLHQLHREPSVARTLSPTGTPLPSEQVDERFDEIIEHWKKHGYGLWMWFEKSSNAFIGRMGVQWTNTTGKDELELSYAIMPGFWGQGLATEASTAVVNLAFNDLNADELVAFIVPNHTASQRVAEKLGFKAEDRVTRYDLEHVRYRLKRADWQKQ